MLERKAKAKETPVSSYMLDCSIAGLERRRNRERKQVETLVANQAILNDINEYLSAAPDAICKTEMSDYIKILREKELELWGN